MKKKLIGILVCTLLITVILPVSASYEENKNVEGEKIDYPIDITDSYSLIGRWDGKINDENETKVNGGISGSISHLGTRIGISNFNIQFKIDGEIYREMSSTLLFRIRRGYPFKIFNPTWFLVWGIYWGELNDPNTGDSEFVFGSFNTLPVDDWYDYGSYVKAQSFKNLHFKFNFEE